ncbi:PKD domain-containing protein [uncultured Methanobrevibacter sp.]|uniref:PKD domain-containing protein n=1 Tax=uncultured Methanobrevibacter sp. TaxID=253161 RepID=UPI002637E868
MFIFFILISSVSASEINSTSSNIYLGDNSDESIQAVNDLDYLSTNSYSMSENELSSQIANESLKTSSNIVNSGFEDELDNGWTVNANGGSVSRDSSVVYEGSYSLHIVGNNNGPIISQSIDFTNIESISFYYYAPSSGGIFNVYILEEGTVPGSSNYLKQFALMGNPTLLNSWTYSGEIDTTSYTGNLNLAFLASYGNIYLDSITCVAKEVEPVNLVVNSGFEDELDNGWTVNANGGSVSRDSSVVYEGSYSLHIVGNNNGPIISQSIDFTNIESISFYYYAPSSGGIFNVYILEEGTVPGSSNYLKQFALMGNPTLLNSWTYSGEIDTTSYTGNLNLAFLASYGNIYLDSINYVTKEGEVYEVTGYMNAPVYFNYTTAEEVTKWFWNFGDGKSSIDPSPMHVYNKTGKYDAYLTIDNDDSKTIKYSVEIIENLVADFEYTITGNAISILDKSSGSIKNWVFNWGDGSTTNITELNNLPNGYNIIHSYPSNILGSFDVTLTVTDKFGNTSTITKEKIVKFYNNVSNDVVSFDFTQSVPDGWTEFNNPIHPTWNGSEAIINFDDYDYITVLVNIEKAHFFTDLFIDDNLIRSVETYVSGFTLTESIANLYGNHKVSVGAGYGIRQIIFGNYKYVADFDIESITIENGNFTVSFKDNSRGTAISSYVWEFDDGETFTSNSLSASLNPSHTFSSGNHWTRLHIYHDDVEMDYCFYNFTLAKPTINGVGYDSIQDAINSAGENDVIDIAPVIGGEFSENLLINKSLTLNFNGAVLSPKDSDVPLFNVTDGAVVTVSDLGLNKDSVLVTDSDSKLIIKDSEIDVDLDLSEGNVDLADDSFNNSILTLVANVNIANSTVSGGSVIVNGGKSRIFNTTLTSCDVAITQTAGELELISNILTGNGVAVNVTGGTSNIAYNLIYNNDKFGLVYVGDDVVFDNNWWATSDDPSRFNGENLSDVYFDVYRLEEDAGVDEFSYLRLKFSSDESVMGVSREYPVAVELVNDDGSEIGGYIKTIDLTVDDEYLVALEDNAGTFALLTSDVDSDNTVLSVLGEEYILDVPVVSGTNVIIGLDGDAVVGGSVAVNVEVPYATGIVTFYVNGEAVPVELNETLAQYVFDNLAAAYYSIVVVYEGNDIFASAVNSTSFNVDDSIVIEVNGTEYNVTVLDGNASELIDGLADLNNQLADAQSSISDLSAALDEANDNITDLNNQLADAKSNISDLSAALDEANATIADLNNQLADAQSNATGLAADIADLNGQLADAQSNATGLAADIADLNGQLADAKSSIDGLNSAVGLAKETIDNLTAELNAPHNATVLVDGIGYPVLIVNGSASIETNISVDRVASAIDYSNMTTVALTYPALRTGDYFVFTLKDANGNALAGKNVSVGFNGHVYTYVTDENGQAKTQVNLKVAGGYTFAVCFLGDDEYNASFIAAKITVEKQKPSLTVPAKSYKASAKTKTLTATFKDAKGQLIKGKKVTFTVNGKSYTASTNAKGVASVKVSLSSKKTYSFTVKFDGDDTFAAVTKTGKVTIK